MTKKIAFSVFAALAAVATLGFAGQAAAAETGLQYIVTKGALLTLSAPEASARQAAAEERKPYFVAYSGGVQTRPVLNRHVVAFKLIEQGYSGFSGFGANYYDFTVYAVNPQDETVLLHIHPTFGIVLGEEAIE